MTSTKENKPRITKRVKVKSNTSKAARRRDKTFLASSIIKANDPAGARIVQMVKTPYTIVNHSYVDYSLVPPGPGDDFPTEIDKMDFHQKLYHMLGQPDFVETIRWLWHGRAFKIVAPSKFEKLVCIKYFGHQRYSSFLYQLGVHGYKQLSTGKDMGAYYSPVCH